MKSQRRVILGEIGFKNEIEMFKNDSENEENILYYPIEFFNESIENISLSFDIWSLGVVFLEILTRKRLFNNQDDILKEDFLKEWLQKWKDEKKKNINTPNICKELEDLLDFIKE